MERSRTRAVTNCFTTPGVWALRRRLNSCRRAKRSLRKSSHWPSDSPAVQHLRPENHKSFNWCACLVAESKNLTNSLANARATHALFHPLIAQPPPLVFDHNSVPDSRSVSRTVAWLPAPVAKLSSPVWTTFRIKSASSGEETSFSFPHSKSLPLNSVLSMALPEETHTQSVLDDAIISFGERSGGLGPLRARAVVRLLTSFVAPFTSSRT